MSRSPERLLRGSNRGGKTMPAAIELAWAVTGQHPYLKYPKVMRCYVVGKDERQIGEVLWPKLSQPGAFKIIRDLESKQWRTYRPWRQDDAGRHDWEPAPPLLPQRFIKSITYYKKKADIPKIVRLKNGAKIYFMTAAGKPPMGSTVHYAWFDEEIPNALWYPEISMRLMDEGGRFVWSATPEGATQEMWDLHERAMDAQYDDDPKVTEHFVHIKDNKYISEEKKMIAHEKITDPEVYRVKVEGEFAVSGFHIYPEFSMQVHGCEPFDVPPHWTRYMVVDPSVQHCAVLFAAVPPPEEGDFVYLYDELSIRNCDAFKFGEHVARKVQGQVFWEFIIDSRAGRQTEFGSGLTHMEQYRRALEARNIRSVQTSHGFMFGMDDPKAGNLAVHDWMRVPDGGKPKLQVFKNRLPVFEEQVKKYRKKKDTATNLMTDEPLQKNNDFPDCLRYLRGRNPKWHKAPVKLSVTKSSYERFKEFMGKFHATEEASFINLGPGRGSSYAKGV